MGGAVPGASVSDRLAALVARARTLEADGVPFPTDQVRGAVDAALAEGDEARAASILKRAETLYSNASRDWMWIRELLLRAEELRDLAERVGVDLSLLQARVGRPREQLRSGPLSAGSLERTAASASLALAILNDALPKFYVTEAQKLGESIRRARDRGEDVTEATAEFRRLLSAIQEEHLPITAQRLLDARRTVARIPRAPAVGPLPTGEEEDILREAKNLARRLHRIRSQASDARSAARLMTQVRAALSEDRRYGSPEEEIEDLWNEVDRLTKERTGAATSALAVEPALETPEGSPPAEAEDSTPPTGPGALAAPEGPEPPHASEEHPPGAGIRPPGASAPEEAPASERSRRRRKAAVSTSASATTPS